MPTPEEQYQRLTQWLETFNQRIAERDDSIRALNVRVHSLENLRDYHRLIDKQRVLDESALRSEYV